VAGIHPAPHHDRTGRFALAALTLGGVVMLLWLVATLAASAFG
jgi:hypothetical protein